MIARLLTGFYAVVAITAIELIVLPGLVGLARVLLGHRP